MTFNDFKKDTAVVGVGTTTFGKLPGLETYDLGAWALKEALYDCGLKASDIDGVIVSRIPDYQRFCESFSLNPRFALTTPGQGRMSGVSIQIAAMAIASGLATTIALVYGNDGRSAGDKYGGEGDRYGSGGAGQFFPYGMTSPGAVHAMMFARHMHQYGTTNAQLSAIPMAFRKHASMNENAVMRELITQEQYLNSKYIAEPLHIFDYCLINDGGVALIMTTKERAKDLKKKPVYIKGVSQSTKLKDSTFPPEDLWYESMKKAADDVYSSADVKQKDLDALMVYDNFSPTVLFSLEGFGFCKQGEGGNWIQNGRLELGGEFPTNTSGGHLSESYMQGWGLNVEAIRQIRGECGLRQVKDANLIQYICAAPVITSIIYGKDAS